MDRVSSGIGGLDDVLNGLMPGDNIVWVDGDDRLHDALQRAFLGADDAAEATRVYVTTATAPSRLSNRLGPDVEVLDARPGQPYADPVVLEGAVLERGGPRARVVIDDLDALVRRLRPERALSLFSRVCPQLFDAGAIAYWRATAGGVRPILDRVRRVTQCVLEVSGGHLRVVKAEGRTGAQGRIFRLRVVDDAVHIEEERALGRLAEGLRQQRAVRNLSQTDLARLAGVSPSAISQAEAGHRGLGLQTVLTLAEGLGIGVDELLSTSVGTNYVIARRDRTAARRGATPLLDDPAAGLRTYLVELGPGERSEPPGIHKGPELVVVAAGLVLVDLGAEAAVVRAGDAVLATKAPVRGWQNLLGGRARLFWILRDPLPSSS